MNIQKNSTLELIKLFASYMVVFVHVPFHGEFGVIILGLRYPFCLCGILR